jgi:hypothetical protein
MGVENFSKAIAEICLRVAVNSSTETDGVLLTIEYVPHKKFQSTTDRIYKGGPIKTKLHGLSPRANL